MKRSRSDVVFDIVNVSVIVLVLLIILYPLYFAVIASFSEPRFVASGQVTFWPKGFTLDAYKNVFKNQQIWTGYRNSLVYTVFGTLVNLVLTIPAAYVLSKKWLRWRKLITWYFLLTMFISGGLIPSFLLVRDLNLVNKPYTLIVLGGLSVYNMVISRIFYQTNIPEEIYEAAHVDGCSHFGQFFRIALPLSTPIIAVMTLFYAVGRWNDFFGALIYVSNPQYYPLQLVLRNILILNQVVARAVDVGGMISSDEMEHMLQRQMQMVEAMKYSLIFIASAPLLAIYPFVQKHFVKGVMIGSLKG